jgi:glycosyltransferase involved in cell wall biosynthesis
MKTASPAILHLTESLTRLGGMEVFLNNWLRADANCAAAAVLDSQQSLEGQERQIGLRPNRLYSLNRIRNHVKNLQLQCGTLICHNFAGLSALSDLIAHERLVVYLHTNSADVWPRLSRLAPFVDGCITCGVNLMGEVKKLLGDSPVTVAPFESPLDDSFFRTRRVKQNDALFIGYAGRLVVEQKRVDRLEAFCRALTAQGVDFRLQITGDGPDKARLVRQLAPFPVKFLGMLKREQVAGIFAGWDFQIVTSDYETGPLTALEGMACGVIPIFPDIPCQAADVLRGAYDRLFYPVGNMMEAASRLQAAASLPPGQMELLRSDLRRLMAPKSMASHLQATAKILEEIHAKPSLRKKIHFQTCWKDHLPLAVRCRLSGGSEFLK